MRFFCALFIILILLLSTTPSHAQDEVPPAGKSGIIEKLLRKSRPRFKPPPEDKPPEIIIKDSRKLIDPGAGPTFFVKRVEIEGNTIFDDQSLAEIVDVGDGFEMTLGVLSLMAQEIMAYYAERGYFLAKAYIPQQEIRDGVVKLMVVEGKVGNIQVTGNKKIKSENIIRRFKRVKKEEVLKEQSLERVLLELNDMLGVKVRSILKPGELPGTSDLILEVTETLPYTFGFDVDNFGSEFTGEFRFGLSASAGNLFTLGDQYSVRSVRSNLDQLFIQNSYLFPITDLGTTLKFSYTYSEQTLGGTLSALNADGNSDIFNMELSIPLYRSRNNRLNVRAGFDIKNSENSTLSEVTSRDELVDIYISLGGNNADRYLGRNFFGLNLRKGLAQRSTDRPLSSRLEGRGTATIYSLNATRYQGTGFMNSYFIMKTTGQITNIRALSPNMFSVGGMGTVRGFPLSAHAGDNGYLLSLEYVFPFPWKQPLGINKLTLDQVLSLTSFIDYGEVFVRNKQPGEKDESITGWGAGVQINIPQEKIKNLFPAVSFSGSYAIPLQGPDPSDGSYGIWYLSGLLNYSF